MRLGRLLKTLLAGGVTLALSGAARGAAVEAPSETAVKAAFLPRFARYVTWPPSDRPGPGAPVVLCIFGRDPFGTLLDQAARSQGVDGHPIIVRRLSGGTGAQGCHLAFVGSSSQQPTGQILAALAGRPVLTITDSRSGAQRGIIHFALVSGRVRFFIDEGAAAKRGLSISSRLLGLAVAVRAR
jgi:hypothetical protein